MDLITEKAPGIEIIEDEKTGIGLASKVILYNDDWHTFEEVIVQLMKATRCTFEEARDKTFEVHLSGKAIVFNGEFSSCLKVSSVLEEIALHTQIET
jgi:ATP-dependent Clp protease adaptor protein ClpS